MQLIRNVEKPTAQAYIEEKCQNPELEWNCHLINYYTTYILILCL